jgi:predicted flap endonuclease-1-like 5' DNA nuclease
MVTHADTLSQLRNLTPGQFEEFVAALWELQGWTTEITPRSNDRGFDVIVAQEFPLDIRIHIQAKRYSDETTVDSSDINNYSGLALRRDVNIVAVVTSGPITDPARDQASDANEIKLVDKDTLTDLIRELGAETLLQDLQDQSWEQLKLGRYGKHTTSSIQSDFPVYTDDSSEKGRTRTQEEPVSTWMGQNVDRLSGVGSKTAEQLHGAGIHTVADLATTNGDEFAMDTTLSKDRSENLVSTAGEWDGGPVKALRGIGSELADTLATAGIHTVDNLAEGDPVDIAAQTGLSIRRVTRWVIEAAYQKGNHQVIRELGDWDEMSLTDISGIGSARADELSAAGVDSVTTLATSDPSEIAAESALTIKFVEKLSREARYSAAPTKH